jgi:cytoplasmic iron level regulating protein YaaA (DUF328/UPF0246 family)
VYILLPPSEGKRAPRSGKPYSLGLPSLQAPRASVMSALVRLCSGDPAAALGVLGLTPGQAAEVSRNALLESAPAAAAAKIYTGVLYESLDLATLPAAATRQARKSLLIFSALWGVVQLADRIPAYRCSAGVNLPGVGSLGPFWRKALAEPLAALTGSGLVVDLRSGPYAGMWKPGANSVAVRVLHERAPGVRTVVSHFNKATKGRVVRDLLLAGASPRSAAELASDLRDLKYTVEGSGAQLDLIVAEL